MNSGAILLLVLLLSLGLEALICLILMIKKYKSESLFNKVLYTGVLFFVSSLVLFHYGYRILSLVAEILQAISVLIFFIIFIRRKFLLKTL